MDALYSHTAEDAAAFASSYYGFAEGLTQEVVCDAGDVVIFTEALTQYVVPHAFSVVPYLHRTGLMNYRLAIVTFAAVERCHGHLIASAAFVTFATTRRIWREWQ